MSGSDGPGRDNGERITTARGNKELDPSLVPSPPEWRMDEAMAERNGGGEGTQTGRVDYTSLGVSDGVETESWPE